jgi:peptidoglycan/xylan/chitin deacetylase (PgdA/CDA1 family)
VAKRFAVGRGVRDGINAGRADRAGLNAIGLESRRLPNYDLDAFTAQAARNNGWLIAYGHDVSESPTPYGCRARDLERLIDSALAAGLDILPVSRAAERFGLAAPARAH